tara:strand:+ start:257 stop:931 length:675 start_codon:yes stop_codon:yes gene_type:complete
MVKNIIVAIDENKESLFKNIVDSLDNKKCMIKIGSVAFNSIGHELIRYVSNKGFDIFLDLKLHDIPNTVKKSIEGLRSLPINMLTIHISGGKNMMQAAMRAVENTDIKIFGVTALTSLNNQDAIEIYSRPIKDQVERMLDLAEEVGIHGIVCSPHELKLTSKRDSLLSLTPGIRLKDLNDDQKRFMSPKQAFELGANYIVIGRAITASNDIRETLNNIYSDINT